MLVTTGWLEEHLGEDNIRIIDCRYVLQKPQRSGAGKKFYLAGHIPGAIHLDIDADLSGKGGPGRHPLPSAANFSKTMSFAGVDQKSHVIAYDDQGNCWAARLWWLLRYFGHAQVSLLDGDFTKWSAEKKPISLEIPKFKARSFKASPHLDWVVDKKTVDEKRRQKDVLLLDARAPERYRGEAEPIDPKAGHIPGAKNSPFANNLTPEKYFKPVEELKKQFENLGTLQSKEIISYCGSGVTACHNLFALDLIGMRAKLYEGSWSDWSSDDSLPVEKF